MLKSNVRNSGDGNFDWTYDTESDFTQDDEYNWHYDIPYSDLADANSFVVFTKANNRSFYAWPAAELTLPASVSSNCYFNTSDQAADTDHRWSFDKPDYAFEKVRISLTYSLTTTNFSMKVTPYISKTLPVADAGGTYYGTFGSTQNVDFTNVTGLTAQKITAANLSTGVLTPATATTLYAGEGALLSATTSGPFSIPVAASAVADASNLLVAGTGVSVDETAGGYTNFILTNKKDVNGVSTSADLKFYKVNTSKAIPAGSAYLHVPTSSLARESFWFDMGTTDIDKVQASESKVNGAFYNLAGQRVAQPTKGLYIVNGKKVVLK
jgi:hypothetical protein